jgi:enhancing lycopene biosynthesis protein 2
VAALPSLRAKDFDFLVVPGGFGAAKNLCDFATRGSKGKAHPEVKRCVEEFFAAGKPIGAVCIAPAVLALSLAGKGLELTVGASGEAAGEIEKLGHKHVEKSAKEWHVDRRHKVVTTPAYMYDDASLKDIFAGILGLVRELHHLA